MIIFILVLGLILRILSLNQSLWLDEAINTLAAKNYSFFDLITKYAPADFHPPGWFIIIWFWTKIFGYSEIAVRIPSVIFGVLTIWVVYLIGKKISSKEVGIIGAILICLNPLHIYYSQEARMYALATLAVCINIYFVIKILRDEKTDLLFLIFSNLLVLSSDYIAYFIFPAQLIFLLFSKKKGIIKKWLLAMAISLMLGIWWIPIFLNQLNAGSVLSSRLPSWKLIVGGFDFKTLPLTFVKFIIGRISLSNKFLYTLILLPLSSLFLYLIWRGVRVANNFSKYLLLSWIVIPPVIATIISVFVPVYSYFRVLFIIPSFVMLIAIGISSFKSGMKYLLLSFVILIEVFCTAVYLINPAYQREDWRGMVAFFKKKVPNSIILFESSGTLPPFDYYSNNDLRASGGLKDFPAKKEEDVINLDSFLKDEDDVYLVDYLVQVSDPNRFISKKLEKLGYKVSDIKNFNGVGFVYHYAKNG